MRVQALVLYATNEGLLYPRHLELAREGAGLEVWVSHVRRAVLPAYRHQFNEPYEGLSLEDMANVAAELKAYYANHIEEGA